MRSSRRDFVKWVTASGIALGMSRLAVAQSPGFRTRRPCRGQGWSPPQVGRGRIDGVAKVTGAKLYASDFRAADLPGWPREHRRMPCSSARRTPRTSMTVSTSPRLDAAAQPSVVVTADDLQRIGTRVPDFYAGDLFCPVGKTPLYLGQPVALLLFETFDAFDQARLAFRDGNFLRFGAETGPVTLPNYGAWRFTRVAGPTPDAPDIYSPLQEGWISPGYFESSGRPIWKPLPVAGGRRLRQGRSLWRGDPRPARGRRSGRAGARARFHDPVRRPDVPRARMRPCLVRCRPQQASSSCSACSRPFEAASAVAYLARRGRRRLQA